MPAREFESRISEANVMQKAVACVWAIIEWRIRLQEPHRKRKLTCQGDGTEQEVRMFAHGRSDLGLLSPIKQGFIYLLETVIWQSVFFHSCCMAHVVLSKGVCLLKIYVNILYFLTVIGIQSYATAPNKEWILLHVQLIHVCIQFNDKWC